MKKKNWIQRFLENWHAKTPKFWKAVIGLCAFTGATTLLLTGLKIPNVPVPEVFTNNAWSIMAGATVIGAFAKTRVKLPKKTKK